LASNSAAAAAAGATLCIVDNELLSFETATLSGTNNYNLTTLYRGLYGTTPATHSTAAPFARLDSSVFQYDLPATYLGKTIYLKFQSYNVFGSTVQELSACTVYSYTPAGAGVSDPIIAQLETGNPVDLGLVTQTPAAVSDDLGSVNSSAMSATDLGAA
jgi:hypothetical protein